MTGAYLRINRNGKWDNIEVDQLTDVEMDEFVKNKPPEKGWVWAVFLAKWIRDNIKEAK